MIASSFGLCQIVQSPIWQIARPSYGYTVHSTDLQSFPVGEVSLTAQFTPLPIDRRDPGVARSRFCRLRAWGLDHRANDRASSQHGIRLFAGEGLAILVGAWLKIT